MSELYTASRIRAFRACPRAHAYRYALGIRTASSPAMAFGTAAHEALEAWYRAWQAAVTGEGDVRLTAALAAVDACGADEIDQIKLRALIVAYHLKWGGEDWEVLAVEQEFSYWLGDVQIGGKIDAIIREATGRVFVVEHKTSATDTSPGAPYWHRLAIDTQISIYLDAGAALDLEFAGCIYDVLKRPMHEIRLATPPDRRKYTDGKGCKSCGGSAKPGAIEQGRGYTSVVFASEVKRPECSDCKGTGWKCDTSGNPQSPRLHANLRATDETHSEYEARLTDEISSRVDDYLSRGAIVRLESDLPRMRQELLDTIESMRRLGDLAPPNHDNCVRGREFCPFFAACSGQADVNDQHVFPRGETHPELVVINRVA